MQLSRISLDGFNHLNVTSKSNHLSFSMQAVQGSDNKSRSEIEIPFQIQFIELIK